MKFDPMYYPYPSRRMAMYARYGMVAASQPLAAQAGLDIMKKGGNAIDAAVAAAACLTVVEPTSNGIGGDAFALVWANGELHGLNASGPSPQSISLEALTKLGYTNMPALGWLPVTVPGVPAAWTSLNKRFGKLPLSEVFEPAIRYAELGYPVTPDLQKRWVRKFHNYKDNTKGEEFAPWFSTFAPKGRAPHIGEMWRSPDHAKTLIELAETDCESFYRGNLADQIDRYSKQYGGYLRKEDLESYRAEWVKPISVNYRGVDVWEIPPNGQGLVALIALNILKRFEFTSNDSIETYHKQIEAIKLAFADGQKYITDGKSMQVRVNDLLSDAYAEERGRLIGQSASLPVPGEFPKSGTVYLAAADREGNMVSFIQSNAGGGFGSGLVVPGTGIALQNRGESFSLDPQHHNRLEPGKKTYHTIIPGFLTRNGVPLGPFGIMGGHMQPQAHVQVIMNLIDFQFNPQAALDAPRWMWKEGKNIYLERTLAEHTGLALGRIGHEITWWPDSRIFGCGQIILRDKNGVLTGGTEPRTDGEVAAW